VGLKTTPWGHQRDAVDFVRQLRGRAKRGAMIAAAMGTGKFAMTVYLCAEEGFQLILILSRCAPKKKGERYIPEWLNR
jgi:hypothetical protein